MRYNLRFSGGLATWFALGLLAGCGLGVTPESRVKHADELLAQGDYGAAMLEIRNALEESPGNAVAELTLTRASLFMNNPEAAERSLDEALKHGADRATAARLRVLLMQQNGAHAELLKQLDANSLPLSPLQRELARSQALAGLRRCPEAIQNARPLLRVAETQVPARIVLAECYARAGYPQLALDLLQAAVQRQPDSAEAWLALGRALQLSGKTADAEASWNTATKLAAGRLTALQQLTMWTVLADKQLARGDLAAARATQQRMSHIAPQGGLTMLLAARLDMADGKLDSAVAQLHTLTNGAPDFDGARSALASALYAGGKREQALAEVSHFSVDRPKSVELRSAVELIRKTPAGGEQSEEYWLAGAGVQMLLGQPAMARLALQSAAKVAPDSPRVPPTSVQLELRTDNGAEALRLAQALQTRRPDDPEALLLLAQSQRMQRDFAAAAETLERLQAQQPTPQTAVLLYSVRRELDPATSLAPLQAWLTKHPDDRVMRVLLTDGLMSAHRNPEAIAEYEKLLAASPKDVVVLNNLAWLYYLQKDPRALTTAKQVYQLAPSTANVIDTYGWLLLESGANEEGLKLLSTAHDAGVLIDPDARYHFAAALARNGSKDEARAQLGLLLEENAQFPERDAAVALAANVK